MRIVFVAAGLLALLLPLPSRADTLILADGKTYEGTVIVKEGVYTLRSQERLFQFRRDEVREHNGEVITPVIAIRTGKGDILVALFEDQAPNTVANIITLAESGFYKGLTFHRIIPDFMAQGGCPNSRDGAAGAPGTGDPGYKFADEIVPELKHTGRGILSMANSGPNTNGSQFFLCFAATPHLDGKHTVFGRAVAGMEVLDRLESIGSETGTPGERVHFDIDVVAKRNHPYEVQKL
ncbi:MAG: peptidylprolyl isomerase [Lentisphaeria bacterium]|nr:peptidylprolyl isomerase [Lentisphaeria bacterium]